jgi:PiT family inorganic phosphate transporter
MHLFGELLSPGNALFLLLALGMALSFEFVNGFHDTANAVATVIYTHSLRPWIAVIWSGLWNLFGVLTSTGAVAFGVVALLPVELVLNVGSGAGFAMVFALLLSAIIWNLGTWYLGLPASSSHTLIGAIMGVGLANSMLSPGHVFGEGVNWAKAEEVFSSLLFSPIVGFIGSALLLLAGKLLIRRPELYEPPPKDTPPPWPVRLLLICTCTGVDHILPALSVINHRAVSMIDGKHGFSELSSPERSKLRSDIYLVGETINKLNKRVAGGGYLRRRSLHRFQPLRYEIKRVTRR